MPVDLNDYFENNSNKKSNDEHRKGSGNWIPKVPNYAVIIVAVIIVLFFVSNPFIIINQGERGIKMTTGKYNPNILKPGLHFIVPFIQKVIKIDTRVRVIHYTSGGDGAEVASKGIKINTPIEVLDTRGLPVSIELSVQYMLNKKQIPITIANWGTTWEDKIINPAIRDIVRSVVGQYEAESLPAQRNKIAESIKKNMQLYIDGLKNQPVILQNIQLRGITLPKKVQEQIEKVQLAKQKVEQEQQNVQQAKQAAIKEEAKAGGVANALLIRAKAKAKANREISGSLTKNLLTLKQLEVQGKFNEALKANKDAKIFLTPGGAVPNIWVDTQYKKRMTTTK